MEDTKIILPEELLRKNGKASLARRYDAFTLTSNILSHTSSSHYTKKNEIDIFLHNN